VIGGGGKDGACTYPGLTGLEEFGIDRLRARCPEGLRDSCVRACTDAGGLQDTDPFCDDGVLGQRGYECAVMGGIALHLGSAFGAQSAFTRPDVDRAACAGKTIMDEWWEYGRGMTLCDPDRTDFVASGFFAPP
jgi:hypothetical protein